MEDPGKELDPYAEWFEIPVGRRPPNHYSLLGLDLFESDSGLIDEAAKKRSAYLHQLASGPDRKIVQRLLGEVAKARRTLISVETKESYDKTLRTEADSNGQPAEISIVVDTDGGGRRPRNRAAGVEERQLDGQTKSNAFMVMISGCVLLLAIGLLAYKKMGTRRVAATPMSLGGPASNGSSVRDATALNTQRKDVLNSLASTTQGRREAGLDSVKAENNKMANRAKRRARSTAKAKKDQVAPTPSAPPAVSVSKPKVKGPIAKWMDGIPLVTDFTGTGKNLFVSDKVPKGLFEFKTGRLFVKNIPAARKWTSIPLKDKSFNPGDAISVKTNFPIGRQFNHRLGFLAGPSSIVLSTVKNGGQPTLVLNAGQKRVATIEKLNGGELKFALYRPKNNEAPLRWFITFANKSLSGKITPSEQSKNKQIALIHTAPKRPYPSPLWIDDLRIGSVEAPPTNQSP